MPTLEEHKALKEAVLKTMEEGAISAINIPLRNFTDFPNTVFIKEYQEVRDAIKNYTKALGKYMDEYHEENNGDKE